MMTIEELEKMVEVIGVHEHKVIATLLLEILKANREGNQR